MYQHIHGQRSDHVVTVHRAISKSLTLGHVHPGCLAGFRSSKQGAVQPRQIHWISSAGYRARGEELQSLDLLT